MDTAKLMGLIAAAAAVCGCNGFNRVSYTRHLPFGEALMVDANQRAILAGRASDDHAATICAEPSPDAITAATLAASAGGQYRDQAQAQASLAMSQSAASIGIRTPSIQLLRDGMYRLCEAHQNGALNDGDYARMLQQYQQMVVGLVAIEQLTGAVTARQVALNAGGASTSSIQVQLGQTLETQLTTLHDWERQQGELRTRIADITRNQAVREAPVPEGETAPEAHRDEANLESYRSEEKSLGDAIAALRQSAQQTMQTMARVEASNASVNAGSSSIQPSGPTTTETLDAEGHVTQRVVQSAENENIQAGESEAEIIAKTVRDITFEIIRTGEDSRDTTVSSLSAETESTSVEPVRRRRGWLSFLSFGHRRSE